MLTIYVIKGLPGVGKTEYVKRFLASFTTDDSYCHYEADQYFEDAGFGYRFDPAKIGNAHAWCQRKVSDAMRQGVEMIFVSNTFSQKWETTVYQLLAAAYGYSLKTIDLFDGGLTDEQLAERNVHNVPACVIARMRERWGS